MGALPKKKLSSIRRGKRLAAKRYNFPALVSCNNCGGKKLPHSLCPHCGQYKGKTFFEPEKEVKVAKVESSKKQ
ncbi:MAG: 50S ribosomal protein L32 [Candidatus Woykebacteria bacterium]